MHLNANNLTTYLAIQTEERICPIEYNRINGTWIDNNNITHPSTASLFFLLVLSNLLFAILIGGKYNTVRIFNKRFYTKNATVNFFWILSFLLEGITCTFILLRYSLPYHIIISLSKPYFIGIFLLHGFAAFVLSLALNSQRKFKTHTQPASRPAPTDPLLAPKQSNSGPSNTVGLSEAFISLILLGYLISFFLLIFDSEDNWNLTVSFLAFYGVQRVLVSFLSIAILISRRSHEHEFTWRSKIFLLLGAIFHLVGCLPIRVWAWILNHVECLWVVNVVDLVMLPYFFSFLFFFLFVRSEYLRNMEECIWDTVSQIQDTFDFRRFN
eukprot:TRINITY_DN2651_c0_g1_i2.p1 TRINITY_DN2651_c0_g1~~TRINITY_DN2651_c0_g1_i2.p1  ORF type:complete len:326 (-),score=36.92 TRINITY_DN2651_c0_g1_i2:1111-2088(-)